MRLQKRCELNSLKIEELEARKLEIVDLKGAATSLEAQTSRLKSDYEIKSTEATTLKTQLDTSLANYQSLSLERDKFHLKQAEFDRRLAERESEIRSLKESLVLLGDYKLKVGNHETTIKEKDEQLLAFSSDVEKHKLLLEEQRIKHTSVAKEHALLKA